MQFQILDHQRTYNSTCFLDGFIRNDFVRVHVGLCTGASLPNSEWELSHVLSANELVRCCCDQHLLVLSGQSELVVHDRSAVLGHSKRLDHSFWHCVCTNVEVVE